MLPIRPMLAVKVREIAKLRLPLYVSPKLDGVRCLLYQGVFWSRTGKPIPNRALQDVASRHPDLFLDGELLCPRLVHQDRFEQYNTTISQVMSIEGGSQARYHVFDCYHPLKSKHERYLELASLPAPFLRVEHLLCDTPEQITRLFEQHLAEGYEGSMLACPQGLYKNGRSTLKEQLLLKLKIFEDAEFEIVAVNPLMKNLNVASLNELGYQVRSHAKDNKVAQETLGALVLKTAAGETFSCGTGFSQAQRDQLWDIRSQLVGQWATVHFFEMTSNDVPRFPVFKALRDIST